MNKEDSNTTDDSQGSQGSTTTDGTFVPDYDVWKPSFYELSQLEKNEEINRVLAEAVLHEVRLGVRAQKYEVVALTKAQQLRNNNKQQYANTASSGGGGVNFESHPELEDMGGKLDPNHIVFPECEVDAQARVNQDPKLQHKLKQKLAQKFGMGSIGSMSKEALEQEYKKKMQNRIKQKPAQQPRFKAQPAPRNTMN